MINLYGSDWALPKCSMQTIRICTDCDQTKTSMSLHDETNKHMGVHRRLRPASIRTASANSVESDLGCT